MPLFYSVWCYFEHTFEAIILKENNKYIDENVAIMRLPIREENEKRNFTKNDKILMIETLISLMLSKLCIFVYLMKVVTMTA